MGSQPGRAFLCEGSLIRAVQCVRGWVAAPWAGQPHVVLISQSRLFAHTRAIAGQSGRSSFPDLNSARRKGKKGPSLLRSSLAAVGAWVHSPAHSSSQEIPSQGLRHHVEWALQSPIAPQLPTRGVGSPGLSLGGVLRGCQGQGPVLHLLFGLTRCRPLCACLSYTVKGWAWSHAWFGPCN